MFVFPKDATNRATLGKRNELTRKDRDKVAKKERCIFAIDPKTGERVFEFHYSWSSSGLVSGYVAGYFNSEKVLKKSPIILESYKSKYDYYLGDTYGVATREYDETHCFQSACNNANIMLEKHVNGCGEPPMMDAIYAICRAAGHRKIIIVAN